MKRTYVENIGQHVDQEVLLKGWLFNVRRSGKLQFLLLRDGSQVIQCVVFKKAVSDELFEQARLLTQESSFWVKGTVTKDDRSPLGYELQVSDLGIISLANDYPITPKEHGTDFLMDNRHLWLRSSRQHAIMRVRHEIIWAIRDFFNDRDFILMDSPIFTPNAAEGTTTLFETDYFEDKAYLTQSGQLYAEAGALAHGKVYCFGPTFRAEKSKTRRHLTEFWMVEPEVAFNDLNDNMDLAEEFVEYIVQRVLQKRQAELALLERDVTKLESVRKPFPRMHYEEAADILAQENVDDFQRGQDFGGGHETILAAKFDRPLLVHHYPADIKAFYMKRDPEQPQYALAVDMLAPEGYGEIIGGSQREDNLDLLLERIAAHKLPQAAFEWYLDLRRFGSVPHSGFGLGVERTVAWICGLKHVRETIPFPRLMSRLAP
jgi:asparaginyl-tRNA synthetase